MMSKNLSHIAILNIKNADYGLSKTEAINLTKNIDLTGEIGTL